MRVRLAPFVPLTMALAISSGVARGDETASCSADFVAFQELQKEGRLLDARGAAIRCARDACPDGIRKVCIGAVDDLAADTPTIVIRAIGEDGCDRADATVSIDGAPREGPLDGRALEVDPGSRAIVVEIGGRRALERTLLVAQGEKNRAVIADLSGGAVCGRASPTGPAAPPPASPPPAEGSRPVTAPTIVFGVVGLASLGASAAFGLSSLARRGDACDDAGCDPAEIDGIRTTFIVGDVLLATGVVSLGVATVLHLTRPTEREAVAVDLGASPAGGRVGLRGTF